MSNRRMMMFSFGSSFDPDALAFITASGLTDNTQKNAINQLVIDLKNYGVWSKMKAIYPFVGGTASTHKWNLKDPRDLDAAFRLVFNGGWTHSATGAIANGTNGYADTFLMPSTQLGLNNTHVSIYARNNPLNMWFGSNSSARIEIFNSENYSVNENTEPSFTAGGAGFFHINRVLSTQEKIYKNGNTLKTDNITSTNLPTSNIFIGARSIGVNASLFSNISMSLFTIGDGLTDTEASNLYTAVQAYQTTLTRQV